MRCAEPSRAGTPRPEKYSVASHTDSASPASLEAACALYDLVVPSTVRVSSTRAAEAAKLTENIFRAVNIALVNELKMIFDQMSIDVREVLDAASSKPFGFMRFDPGPGWGGHCIPVDPFYLAWKAREVQQTARFVELAGSINVEMPRYVVSRLQRALNDDMRARREAVTRDGSGTEFDLSHDDIVAAIATGDPEGARIAMRRHFGITTTGSTTTGSTTTGSTTTGSTTTGSARARSARPGVAEADVADVVAR